MRASEALHRRFATGPRGLRADRTLPLRPHVGQARFFSPCATTLGAVRL